jgi:hypothetical protein
MLDFFRRVVYMRFHKILEKLIVLCLFIATVGTTYVFIATIIFGDKSYSGFYSSWQMPMLFALFIDAAYYKHINRVNAI